MENVIEVGVYTINGLVQVRVKDVGGVDINGEVADKSNDSES